jgi:hypothetical protein
LSSEDQLSTRVTDLTTAGLINEQLGVDVDALLIAIVSMDGYEIIPDSVVTPKAFAHVPVTTGWSIRGESHFPCTETT